MIKLRFPQSAAFSLFGFDSLSTLSLSKLMLPECVSSESGHTQRTSDEFSQTFEDIDLLQKKKPVIAVWLPFALVVKILWQRKF